MPNGSSGSPFLACWEYSLVGGSMGVRSTGHRPRLLRELIPWGTYLVLGGASAHGMRKRAERQFKAGTNRD